MTGESVCAKSAAPGRPGVWMRGPPLCLFQRNHLTLMFCANASHQVVAKVRCTHNRRVKHGGGWRGMNVLMDCRRHQ